jgi:hypothetical protein
MVHNDSVANPGALSGISMTQSPSRRSPNDLDAARRQAGEHGIQFGAVRIGEVIGNGPPASHLGETLQVGFKARHLALGLFDQRLGLGE